MHSNFSNNHDSQFDNIKLSAFNSYGKSKIDIINCTFSNIPYTYAIFSNDDKYVIKNCSFKKVLIGICFNQCNVFVIHNNLFENIHDVAIEVMEQSCGGIHENSFKDIKKYGVIIGNSNVFIKKNNFHSLSYPAIAVDQGSISKIIDNKIEKNLLNGVLICSSKHVEIILSNQRC